jgi:hypothetical protein
LESEAGPERAEKDEADDLAENRDEFDADCDEKSDGGGADLDFPVRGE